MKRRTFTILSALSLALCMTTAGLWVRSYWVADNLQSYSNLRLVGAGSVQGRLTFGMLRFRKTPVGTVARWLPLPLGPGVFVYVPGWKYFGFGVRDASYGLGHSTTVFIPHWFVLVMSIALPAQWFRIWRRTESEKRRGLCRVCGYDLRASPDRCPECGTPKPVQVESRR